MPPSLYSLSISARVTLNMHSLNNEGGEGNQTQTRMVNIVDEHGQLHNVNAISGDMLKHIQAEHFFRLSGDYQLPLCAGCREFNANRISADSKFEAIAANGDMTDAAALDTLLQWCALDDVAGNLITAGKRSLPRKSIAEFGWVVALPDATSTDSYFHVKYASERSSQRRKDDASEEQRGSNLGQAIFHRPASSGVYAVVTHLELARIGFNDIMQTYALDAEQRQLRYNALLESLLYTFLEPNGAMRSTQNPHIVDAQGVVAISSGPTPAPTISPLNADYREQIQGIAAALESIRPGAVVLYPFDSLAGLSEILCDLINNTSPYELRYNGAR